MHAAIHCAKSSRGLSRYMLGRTGYGLTTVRYFAPSSISGVTGRFGMFSTRFHALMTPWHVPRPSRM